MLSIEEFNSFNDDPAKIKIKTNAESNKNVIVAKFEKLILFNIQSFPDITKMVKDPYYNAFQYNVNNDIISFLANRLQGSEFEKSTLNIIKNPYNVYSIGNGSNLYIFSVDLENTTDFFTETLILYTSIINGICIILACKSDVNRKHEITFTEYNNVRNYKGNYGEYIHTNCTCGEKILGNSIGTTEIPILIPINQVTNLPVTNLYLNRPTVY